MSTETFRRTQAYAFCVQVSTASKVRKVQHTFGQDKVKWVDEYKRPTEAELHAVNAEKIGDFTLPSIYELAAEGHVQNWQFPDGSVLQVGGKSCKVLS